jgi:hypothetical protein
MAEVQQCRRCGAWMVPPLQPPRHRVLAERKDLAVSNGTQLPTEIEMKHDRDRLQQIMEMFHQFGEIMISADSLQEAIECGDFEANGFARNQAEKLGQALVEHGLVFDATLAH